MEKTPTHRECFAGGLSLLIWFMSVTIGEPEPLVQIFVNPVTLSTSERTKILDVTEETH